MRAATAEIFVAASLGFSLLEGVVCAFIGSAWASRGAPIATVVAAITAVLATPGRWEVAYLRTGLTPQLIDLMLDLGLTVAAVLPRRHSSMMSFSLDAARLLTFPS